MVKIGKVMYNPKTGSVSIEVSVVGSPAFTFLGVDWALKPLYERKLESISNCLTEMVQYIRLMHIQKGIEDDKRNVAWKSRKIK